jgi:ferredoxin--NADP+ reductase
VETPSEVQILSSPPVRFSKSLGESVQTFSVAIVGAGPAGYFTALALNDHQNHHMRFFIDIFERLPTPWGLVRSGVAPDHQRVKSVSRVFEKISAQPNVRLLANVNVGTDVTVAELKRNYDVVVVAVGTPIGRSLGISGEQLPNVFSSADFVFWYNGHPDYKDLPVDLSGTNAVVLGAGNVALDVGRMLSINPIELDATDMADHALATLHQSNIQFTTIAARRGAECANFTSQELRELSNIESVQLKFDRSDILSALECAGPDPDKRVKGNLNTMLLISNNADLPRERTLRFLFRYTPIQIKGENRVESVVFDTPFGKQEIPCDLLVTAIGYQPKKISGLVTDGNRYFNQEGFVEDNLYVVGWAKRGPNGVIGTNKSDAAAVVSRIVSSLSYPKVYKDVLTMLEERGVAVISQMKWARVNEEELRRGRENGRARVKMTSIEEVLKVANLQMF